jgi:hypothetical protein
LLDTADRSWAFLFDAEVIGDIAGQVVVGKDRFTVAANEHIQFTSNSPFNFLKSAK